METVIKTTRLTALQARQCGRVEEIEPPDDDMVRLLAMGICRGQLVEVIQAGNPMIVRVHGSRIGVSNRLAHRILVLPEVPAQCPLN